MPMRTHHTFPKTKLGCFLAVQPTDLRRDYSGRNSANNAMSDLILNRENVFECAIIAVRD